MTHNDAVKRHKCVVCNYSTNRRFDLKRHENAVHNNSYSTKNVIINNEEKVNPNEEKVNPKEEKVNPNEEKVNPKEEKVNPLLICKKMQQDL